MLIKSILPAYSIDLSSFISMYMLAGMQTTNLFSIAEWHTLVTQVWYGLVFNLLIAICYGGRTEAKKKKQLFLLEKQNTYQVNIFKMQCCESAHDDARGYNGSVDLILNFVLDSHCKEDARFRLSPHKIS